MARTYTDEDVEAFSGENGTIYPPSTTTSPMVVNAQQERYGQNNSTNPAPPTPKVFDDKRVSGLLDTFNSLMEKAQGTHKARAAQIYSGLASVVGGMMGDVMKQIGQDTEASTSARGQDITMRGQDQAYQLGLSRLSLDAASHSETASYHNAMLGKMADELGLNKEKFANEKAEFATRSGLDALRVAEEQKRTGIEQGRLDMMKDVATSGKMESAIAQQENIYARGKISAQEKLGELGQTSGFFGWGAKPTKAQNAVDALEVQRQSGLAAIYKRYGTDPNTGALSSVPADDAVPYWKQILGVQ
jgi:hypothetical protein